MMLENRGIQTRKLIKTREYQAPTEIFERHSGGCLGKRMKNRAKGSRDMVKTCRFKRD